MVVIIRVEEILELIMLVVAIILAPVSAAPAQ